MELRHLRYFTAVAEETTLVAAAKRLGVAQPALTRQIHALERELDVDLFERGPRGVSLTPAGEVVLASAHHVLRQVDAAVERARGSSRGVAGRCVLCSGARALASGLIARILVRLNAQYPAIELGVTEGAFDRQFRAIQLGEADIGIGAPATAEFPDLASETIDYDVFDAIVIADTNALASRASLTMAELTGETFITWRSEGMAELRRHIATEFTRIGFAPAAQREYDEIFAVGSAVAAGQGWTFIFHDARALAPPGTTIVPLVDLKLPLAHALVWRANERRPVVRTVMDVVRQLVAEERRARDGLPPPRARGPIAAPAVPNGDPASPATRLELRHLRYFCAVVDAGSFGRAAEQLDLTQPALSRQVGDLERITGVPLLERAARGTSTSPAGDSFYRSASRVLHEVESIQAEAKRARRGVIAHCVVALVPTASARGLLTALMRECAQDIPHLELAFKDLPTPAQPAALRAGHIDLGVCHASPLSTVDERGVERAHLTTDLVNCALVAVTSPLAARRELSFHDLANVPFLFPDRSFQPAMYDQLFAVFDRHAFRPRVDATYDGLLTIWALVAQGHGWGIGFASQCDAPPPGTVSVPIERFSLPWGLDLLSRDTESRSLILELADRLHAIAHATAAPGSRSRDAASA